MKAKHLLIPFALGLGLALVWVLGGKGGPAVAAPRVERDIEAHNVPAAELHVCPSGCAYSSIQAAVDAAADGDVIKVAAGTYTGVNYRYGLAQIVYIDKTVTIRGGYTTDNWMTSDPESNPTTLDAMGQGRVLYITGDINSTVEGLQMIGGDAAGLGGSAGSIAPAPDAGGAVYIVNASATIRDNRIRGNSADRGGGLYLLNSASLLCGNQVSGNTASSWSGGGVYLAFSNATLSGNAVISNTSGWGGGLYVWDSAATIRENVILFNTATGNGGGLVLDDCAGMMINNVVADNRASSVGSGLAIYGSSPRLLHTTFARNRGGDGSGVFVDYGTVVLKNTIMVSQPVGVYAASGATVRLEATLWGSGAWANATDWDGDGAVITGTVNIWGDPAFVEPDNGDYHIGAGSAAVDAGVDAEVYDDIDGDDRPLDGNLDGTDEFDIGADEFCWPDLDLVITKRATPDQVQSGGQLTYTLTLFGPGLNARLWDPLPSSLDYVSNSITSTLVPTPVYSPTTHAIVWRGMLPADTVRMIQFKVRPDVGTGLQPVPVANVAWLTDIDNQRSVSATATVNVWPLLLFLEKQATPSDGLHNNEPLTYTLSIFGPRLNVSLWDPLPPMVRYVEGSITGTVAPIAIYSPTAHAIAWEGGLPSDTVETIRFQVTRGITGAGSLNLSLPIVNTAWLTATESGRSVSAMAIVNGRHVYLPLVVRNP